MSADDSDDELDDDPLAPEDDPLAPDEPVDDGAEDRESADGPSPRDRIEEGADRAIESFDEGVVDLLSWLLDTETRARIYVHLRQQPDSTSKEVAEGTGLYPSTVREALANLHEEDVVTRQKRQSEGAGNNPYEYAAIPPSDLVGGVVEQIQGELNAVFRLDERLEDDGDDGDEEYDDEPVTITVQEHDDLDPDLGPDADADSDGSDGSGDAAGSDPTGPDGPADDRGDDPLGGADDRQS